MLFKSIFFVIVLFKGLVIQLHASTDALCKNGETFLPVPDNPAKYIRCLRMKPLILDCIQGTIWNQRLLTCEAVDTQITDDVSKISLTVSLDGLCKNGETNLPYPNNDSKYIVCIRNKPIVLDCKTGTVWNQNKKECQEKNLIKDIVDKVKDVKDVIDKVKDVKDLADKVIDDVMDIVDKTKDSLGDIKDKIDSIVSPPSGSLDGVCKNGETFLPYPNNPAKFIQCNHGFPVTFDCGAGTIWFQEKKWCEEPIKIGDKIKDIIDTVKDVKDKIDSIVSPPSGSLEGLCKDWENFLPYPNNPKKFIRCNHGFPVVFDCPEGEIWFQAKSWCDHPEEVIGGGGISDLIDKIKDGKDSITGIIDKVKDGKDSITGIIDKVKDGKDSITGIIDKVKDGKDSITGIIDKVKDGKDSITGIIDKVKDGKDSITGIIDKVKDGKDSITGIIDKVKDGKDSITDVIDKVKDPSDIFDKINEIIDDGLIDGDDGEDIIVDESDEETDDVNNNELINTSFLKLVEGFRTDAYCIEGSVESGVTIGIGVDLGQNSYTSLKNLGVSQTILDKLKPYLKNAQNNDINIKGQKACDAVEKNKVKLTVEEALSLSSLVKQKNVQSTLNSYNAANKTGSKSFVQLSCAQRTVIASVLYQYGSTTRVPNFWKAVTANDWKAVISELRNFGDAYESRRKREANLIEFDSGKVACPDIDDDICKLTKGSCVKRSTCQSTVLTNFCQNQAADVSCCTGASSSNKNVDKPTGSSKGCSLIDYTNDRVKSAYSNKVVRVHEGFKASMDLITKKAEECDVILKVTSSFRKDDGRKLSGAIVTPSKTSNHFVGHSIDFNLVLSDKTYCNSACLQAKKKDDVKCFIDAVKKTGLRWGGDFSIKDPVHFDDGLNLNNKKLWDSIYSQLQKNC